VAVTEQNERNSVDHSLTVSVKVEHLRTEENDKLPNLSPEIKEARHSQNQKKGKTNDNTIVEMEEEMALSPGYEENANVRYSAKLETPEGAANEGHSRRTNPSKINFDLENVDDTDKAERKELNSSRSFDIKKGKFADIVVPDLNGRMGGRPNPAQDTGKSAHLRIPSSMITEQNRSKLYCNEEVNRNKDKQTISDIIITAV